MLSSNTEYEVTTFHSKGVIVLCWLRNVSFLIKLLKRSFRNLFRIIVIYMVIYIVSQF